MRQPLPFIEYTTVDLNKMPHFLPSDGTAISAYANQLVQICGNRPVELLGEAPRYVVAQIFVALIHVATEIIYRKAEGEYATIVFSQLGNTVERPSYVIPIEAWEKGTEETRSIGQELDAYTVDMAALWQTAHEKYPTYELSMYLQELTRISPRIPRITLLGEDVPILPLLWTIHWFYPYTKVLLYHDIQLN